ncbi:carbamoyl-phosphate synthase large subunit [Candidatus Micrarchaeota archaeon]|nr:carbamoyl-phosphate synthase large subunit [Candidatus Micrarchaeota archaeon]
MPKSKDLHKVLIIGSGPIVIGQAAEFDYSGAQACRALREDGVKVVLANSNPATIQTDLDTADVVYLEPLTPKFLERIIEREKPDGIIATMAGQTGLNLAVALKETLGRNNVRVLGTGIETIELAEDREKFRELIRKIGEPIPKSIRGHSIEEVLAAGRKIGFPVIIRADYCLGGKGSGIAENEKELEGLGRESLDASTTHSALVEQSIAGLAEIEYEVIRDSADNCITICSMENVDPVGVHTGESIVVAPAQTLSDRDHQMLRSSAIKVVRALGVRGACNIQFALNQQNGEYWIIEVNPRASRSSALASKATGYPIARVAAKIALGYTLPEITNEVTGKTACFEPALDYCVLKIPRWPFDKFRLEGAIGTSMKSTGETMAIGRTFEAALLKAVRSLELRPGYEEAAGMVEGLAPHELRLFKLKRLMGKGAKVEELAGTTRINPWFLRKIGNIVEMERRVAAHFAAKPHATIGEEDVAILLEAKRMGLGDERISSLSGRSVTVIRAARLKLGIRPSFKMVDTCAAEFEALTPYFYSCYGEADESGEAAGKKTFSPKRRAIVLGGGPIRIGQGIEFDYCTVHAVEALRKSGIETIVVNNNPETVSTDFDVSDKLYFEPLTVEDVFEVYRREAEIAAGENAETLGVFVQFGGQTAINLARPLHELGVKILGTSPDCIDSCEDRKKFKRLMKSLSIPIVESGVAYSREEALSVANYVGYPVLIRPSYVLGGRAMEVVYDERHMLSRIDEAVSVSQGRPIAIDHFIRDGIEIDVDLVADGTRACIAGIMEQVEEAGIHSGDSACVLPPKGISPKALEKIRAYSHAIASAAKIVGSANIQMACKGDEVVVLEVNPRSSRTMPFVSKAVGIPIAKISALLQAGEATLETLGLPAELPSRAVCVKVPVFPFSRFARLDCKLGAEMKSTGEVMGIAGNFPEAYLKAQLAAGNSFGTTACACDCGRWAKIIGEKLSRAGVKVHKCTSAEAAKLILEGKCSFLASGLEGAGAGGTGGQDIARAAAIAKCIPCITSSFAALAIADSIRALAGREAGGLELHPLNAMGGGNGRCQGRINILPTTLKTNSGENNGLEELRPHLDARGGPRRD